MVGRACLLSDAVLLGVVEQQLKNEVFAAEMERKLAQLLSEVSPRRRMWRRATVAAGNGGVVQVLQTIGCWGRWGCGHLDLAIWLCRNAGIDAFCSV